MVAELARCPDPRGPLIDRADFLEGRLEALREIKAKVGEALYDARMEVSLVLAGETDAVPTASAIEQLMDASHDVLDHLDDEITHARWKLSAARRRDGGQS